MEDAGKTGNKEEDDEDMSKRPSSELEAEYLQANEIDDDNVLSSLPDEAKDDYLPSAARY